MTASSNCLPRRRERCASATASTRAEIGPLVSEAARAKVMRLVDDAVAHGATAVTGGRIPPAHNVGWFYEPTILTGVTPDMAICREECFGPVAAICRVKDFDEAIRLANDSPFGLGASIFTTDLAEAMEAAERLEAGMVWVNNPLIDNDALPFGGWKASGLGRELGRQGLDAFRRSKMVIIDHKPAIQDWWYPYPDDWFRDERRPQARLVHFACPRASWRIRFEPPAVSAGHHKIRSAFGNHHDRRVRVSRNNAGHDRSVGNDQIVDAANAERGIDHRHRVVRHFPFSLCRQGWKIVVAMRPAASTSSASLVMSAPGADFLRPEGTQPFGCHQPARQPDRTPPQHPGLRRSTGSWAR